MFAPEMDGDPARERLDGSHIVVAGGQPVGVAKEVDATKGKGGGPT
jgi:hypothetical protein